MASSITCQQIPPVRETVVYYYLNSRDKLERWKELKFKRLHWGYESKSRRRRWLGKRLRKIEFKRYSDRGNLKCWHQRKNFKVKWSKCLLFLRIHLVLTNEKKAKLKLSKGITKTLLWEMNPLLWGTKLNDVMKICNLNFKL